MAVYQSPCFAHRGLTFQMKRKPNRATILVMSTTEQILTLLIAERDRLTRAIDALQGKETPTAPISQSERMKAVWAARKAKGKG